MDGDDLPHPAGSATKKRLELLCRQEGLEPQIVAAMVVRAGKPFELISEAARGLKVDLIILATRGHTGLKHAWLGSTAERVIRHAPGPVLTVRGPRG